MVSTLRTVWCKHVRTNTLTKLRPALRKSTRVIVNSGYLLLQRFVDIGSQVFLLAYVLRHITQAAYGVFLLGLGFCMLLQNLAAGINKGCIVGVSKSLARDDRLRVNTLISTASTSLGVGALFLAIILLSISRFIPGWLAIDQSMHSSATTVFILVGINVLLVIPQTPYQGICMGHQRYDLVAISQVASRITRTIAVVLFFTYGLTNVSYVMGAFLIGNLLQRVLVTAFAYRLHPGLRVRPSLFDRSEFLPLVTFGGLIALTVFANAGTLEATKWFIGTLLGVETITYVVVSLYITQLLRTLVHTVTITLVPVASDAFERRDAGMLSQMVVRSTRYAAILSLGGAAILLPSLKQLFALWLQPDLAWLAPYGMAAGVSIAIFIPASSVAQILTGTGDATRPLGAMLAKGLIILVTTFLGITLFDLRFSAALVGICAGEAIYWGVLLRYGFALVSSTNAQYIYSAYVQPLIAATATAAMGWAVTNWIDPTTWGTLVFIWFLSCVCMVVTFMPFVTTTEWLLLRSGIRRVMRSPSKA